MTPKWVSEAVFYQIFPDRFSKSERMEKNSHFEKWDSPPTVLGFKGGDLYGVSEKLEELKDLGVNALYFNPIFASAANHRYHTYDYFKVDPLLGGNEAFKELVDKAHSLGIRIILDGVFNHASRGFFAFNHVMENGSDSPYQDWFHFNKEWLKEGKVLQAFRGDEDHQEDHDKSSVIDRLGYHAWWGLPALPKFNTDCKAVRDYIFEVAEYWVKFGIDGWRLDVPEEIDDDVFWQEFRARVKNVNPDAYIVGEIWEDGTRWLQGDQFDAVMNYYLCMNILDFVYEKDPDPEVYTRYGNRRIKPVSMDEMKKQLKTVLSMYPEEIVLAQLNLLGSHDTPRVFSILSENQARYKLAYHLLFTLPGAPCIYYGDELGMTGRHDPDCRKSYPSSLEDLSGETKELRNFFKEIIKMRKDSLALQKGSFELIDSEDDLLIFKRVYKNESVTVIVNRNEEEKRIVMLGSEQIISPLSILTISDFS
jgi:neopullulanase